MATVKQVYETYLDRTPSQEEINAYEAIFGNYVDPGEIEQFLSGAVASGERTQAQIDPLVSALREDVSSTDPLIQNLYKTYLGREADPYGGYFYEKEFGEDLSPEEIQRFVRGAAGEVGEEGVSSRLAIEDLYRTYLGRGADAGGLKTYLDAFGPSVDQQERATFIRGAMNAGELSAEQGAKLLADLGITSTTQDPTTTGLEGSPLTNVRTAAANPALQINRPADYGQFMGTSVAVPTSTGLRNLYRSVLGREPDPSGYNAYMEAFGSTIDPFEMQQFRAGAQGELAQRAEREAFDRAQFRERIAQPMVAGSARYTGGLPAALSGGQFTPSAFDFTTNIRRPEFVAQPGLGVNFPVPAGAAQSTPGATDIAVTNLPGMRDSELTGKDAVIEDQNQSGGKAGGLVLYAGGPVTGSPQYFAEGGLSSIAQKGYAEELRAAGRYGDTILAHINPEEAKLLSQVSGPPSINPETGLPEFFWKKLFRLASFALPFVAGPLGLSAIQTGLVGGLLGGASAKKGFSFKQGLMSGLTAFMGAKAAEGLTAAGAVTPAAGVEGAGVPIDAEAFSSAMAPAAAAPTPQPVDPFSMTQTAADVAGLPPPPQVDPFSGTQTFEQAAMQRPAGLPMDTQKAVQVAAETTPAGSFYDRTVQQFQDMGKGIENVFSSDEATRDAAIKAAGYAPIGYALTAPATYDGMKFADIAAIEAKKRKERRMLAEAPFGRVFPNIQYTGPYTGATGGLIALAKGGAIDPVAFEGGGMTAPVNQPRMLAGGGDGMSDSIPATIDGTQPARLADGEFVIPADVVADIGNGSSSAGAKRLYGMMDRVREARHGTTKQPPEIKMNRLMPA